MALPPTDPRHGTHAGYVAGCRGECCLNGRRRYEKRRRLRMLAGPLTVTTDRAAAHVAELVQLGMAPTQVDTAAGIPESTCARLPRMTHILATTETKILAVTARPGVNYWPARGAVRRLRALVALGHSAASISKATGMSPTALSMMLNQRQRTWTHVRPPVWGRIVTAYERLSMIPGDSQRSRNRAATNGWAPPLAWDDIDLDAQPHGRYSPHRSPADCDPVVVQRALDGERIHTTRAEKDEIVRRWKATGRPVAELERRLGIKPERYGKGDAA